METMLESADGVDGDCSAVCATVVSCGLKANDDPVIAADFVLRTR